ncbi:MAG: hypothetical protein EOP61_37945, partial [Sphingomonadales bacterium]
MAARLHQDHVFVRLIVMPLALGVAMYVTARYSMSYIQPVAGFWLANGLALAVLLRTPQRSWPLLVLGALAGTTAAGIAIEADPLPTIIGRSLIGAAQYGLCAWLLRRQFGDYFDLLVPRHLIGLGLAGADEMARHEQI